jgi:HPt (histidine-containing phosphotransfer) domain-containing protein
VDPLRAAPEVECVDLQRLLEFTNGDPDSFRELATLYLTQTREQLEQLAAAVQTEATGEVRRIAHSCAGASATCGMRRLVPLLRELERQGAEEKLHNAANICQEANREFDCVRKILEAHLSKDAELAAKV